MDAEKLRDLASQAVKDATAFSFDCQKPDGHWVAEVSSDATFTSEYVMFKYAMGMDLAVDGDSIRRWLLQDQKPDGSWGLAPELAGNVSTTTEAYLALKILGVPPHDPAMLRSRDFMIKNGGVAKVRFFTRFFLATFGLYPWSAIPQLPAELILMPPSSPLNIYILSSWARSTLIPILIVDHHQPIYALPNGLSSSNDFLDELWVDPSNKNVPYAPPLSTLFWERSYVEFGFTAIDKLIAKLGNGLRDFKPLRDLSRKKCIEWLLEHQEEAGDWAGFFPPMHGSIWALILEGFPLDCKAVRLGLAALERLATEDATGKRIAATVSPVWDTALMASALCDAGVGSDPRVQKAADWTKAKQLNDPTRGDWRIYCPTSQAGGWSFEYENTWYPDVDDTAVVVMALVKQDFDGMIASKSITDAVDWMIGMQNPDGGWAAFDHGNDKLWLHKIPFSDMDSLCDPSSSDITGRIIECFGFLLSHQQGHRINPNLRKRMDEASWKAVEYLLKEQEVPTSAWWGRWGNNYIYGSSNVLRGLEHFAKSSAEVRQSVQRAIDWFESIQNEDGGWGETLKSYTEPELVGRGVSTAAQTAWAIQALLPYRSTSSSSIQRGIRWLVENQTVESEHGKSWTTDVYTGTGFPKVLYLGYPYYHHAFPIMALSRYAEAVELEAKRTTCPIELTPSSIEAVNKTDVLIMVVGSRGDIQPFLRIASILQKLHGCHIRVATHNSHREQVESQGLEFYSVGGSPEVFAKVLGEKPNVIRSFFNGELTALQKSFHSMTERFWRAAIDSAAPALLEAKLATGASSDRPFVADIITSNPPTQSHMYAAEALNIPLTLVSVQPDLPTGDHPHYLTMTKPRIQTWRLWNLMSYHGIQAMYVSLNTRIFVQDSPNLQEFPRVLILSQSSPERDIFDTTTTLVPRAPEWNNAVTIAGYASSPADENYMPPKSLENFLDTDQPVLVVGFGSMNIPWPSKTLSMIGEAIAAVGAKAVICGTWPKDIVDMMSFQDDLYFIYDVPHSWLLPRVQGFVHHGGAGHTAAGMKAGVPMLVLPFFLDQNFWAAKTHDLGLGPAPIPFRDTTEDNLVASMRKLLSPGAHLERCRELSTKLSNEQDGAEVVADMLESQIKRAHGASCSLIPTLKGPWRHVNSGLSLSGVAAASLVSQGTLQWSDLDLHGKSDTNTDPLASTRPQDFGIFWLLMSLYHALLQVIFTILGWKKAPRDKLKDPVFQARMKQSKFHLNLVEEEEPERDVREQVQKSWQLLVVERFQDSFMPSI
ncbi:squalene cyclase [Paramyrothecium foliicola]|nr:squalene cyclase [Paramyrothecium foliicola]